MLPLSMLPPADQQPAKHHTCPQCGGEIEEHAHFVTWCDQCNWNVEPQQARATTPFERLYVRLGQRMSQKLFDDVMHMPVIKPTFSFSKCSAFVIAVLVHTVTFIFLALGVCLLIWSWPNIIAGSIALLCCGIAWITRPRLVPMPSPLAARATCPALYQFVDRVADALGTRRVDGVVVDHRFNAAFTQAGLARKHVVFLGLPLVKVLNAQELVAIVAHELAHGRNGDPLRGLFVGSAIDTLTTWSFLVHPERIWQPTDSSLIGFLTTLVMVPVNIAFIGLSKLLWAAAYGLSALVYRDSQRAEYLADYLAATVSGTGSMLSGLEKTYLDESFNTIVQGVALNRSDENVFNVFQQYCGRIPARELERLRRVHLAQMARLDATHPPTAHRVAFLQAHRVADAKVTLSEQEAQQIARELQMFESSLQHTLINEYKSQLYY